MMTLTDTRGKKGKRYSLALVLTFVLLAKLAGETTLQAITNSKQQMRDLDALLLRAVQFLLTSLDNH
jgi:hypothetical protein